MWEWRVFIGADELSRFPAPGAPLATAREREDLYLLLPATFGLKVRAHGVEPRCELKVCSERDPEGPQLWTKVFEEPLPLVAPRAEEIFRRLGRGPAAGIEHAAELAARLEARTLLVKKRVAKVPVGAASVERAEVTIGGLRLATVCVEAATHAACLGAGRELGLDGERSESYPERLLRL